MSQNRLFVLCKCEVGKTEAVGSYISDNIHEALEVYSITGEYDLLLKFAISSLADMETIVQERLHTVPHIRETYTFLSFRVYGKDIGDFVS